MHYKYVVANRIVLFRQKDLVWLLNKSIDLFSIVQAQGAPYYHFFFSLKTGLRNLRLQHGLRLNDEPRKSTHGNFIFTYLIVRIPRNTVRIRLLEQELLIFQIIHKTCVVLIHHCYFCTTEKCNDLIITYNDYSMWRYTWSFHTYMRSFHKKQQLIVLLFSPSKKLEAIIRSFVKTTLCHCVKMHLLR